MHLAFNLEHASQSKMQMQNTYDKKLCLCQFYLISAVFFSFLFPPAAKKEQLEQECWTDGTFHLDYFSH